MITTKKIESLLRYWDKNQQELLQRYDSGYILITKTKKKRTSNHRYFKTQEELLKTRPNLLDFIGMPDFLLINVDYENNPNNQKREEITLQESLLRFASLGLEGIAA